MKARQHVTIGPLHEAPAGPWLDPGAREELLSDALRGVELGAYDELFVAQLVRHTDAPALRTLVSLFERIRAAGMRAAVELEAELQERARRQAPRYPVAGDSEPDLC